MIGVGMTGGALSEPISHLVKRRESPWISRQCGRDLRNKDSSDNDDS